MLVAVVVNCGRESDYFEFAASLHRRLGVLLIGEPSPSYQCQGDHW